MEKPVVATSVGGIPDIVTHGDNGFLVSPGNVPELTGAIKRILDDENLARKMGKAGRNRVNEQFSVDFMVESIEKVYHDLLIRKRVRFES